MQRQSVNRVMNDVLGILSPLMEVTSFADILGNGESMAWAIDSIPKICDVFGVYPPDPRPIMQTLEKSVIDRRVRTGASLQSRFLSDVRDIATLSPVHIASIAAEGMTYAEKFSLIQDTVSFLRPQALLVVEQITNIEDVQQTQKALQAFCNAFKCQARYIENAGISVIFNPRGHKDGWYDVLDHLIADRQFISQVISPKERMNDDGQQVLELGAGMRPTPNCTVYHDRFVHSTHIDIGHDLNLMPWPWRPEQFDSIIALDVMEHLKVDIQQWLDECWRILKPGGVLFLRLPQWNNPVSYRDPTHVRVFHKETFHYWDQRTPLYKDYGSIYFAEAKKWWTVAHVDEHTNAGDLGIELRKVVNNGDVSDESP